MQGSASTIQSSPKVYYNKICCIPNLLAGTSHASFFLWSILSLYYQLYLLLSVSYKTISKTKLFKTSTNYINNPPYYTVTLVNHAKVVLLFYEI